MARVSRFATPALAVLVSTVALVAQQPSQPAAAPDAQGLPPVTFRVDVDYVEVDAIVTDKNGNVVTNLEKADFQVFEDGKPQKIDIFTKVEIPIERAEKPLFAASPVEPDVQTNDRPFDGRLYVIALDDLHTAATRSQGVKKAAKDFIERGLGANDLAAVVHLSGRSDAGQEFTGSKRLLEESVDRFMGRRLRSATLNKIDDYNRWRDQQTETSETPDPRTQKFNDSEAFERGYNARTALDTLKSLAEYMAGIRGRRKAIVLFSEGIDYDIYNVFDNQDASVVMDSVRATIGAATRANVSFYGIDPRGLYTMSDETMEMQPVENTTLGLDQRGFRQELQLSQDSLRVLSEQTGGFATVETNDFVKAFERIVKDNSSYYVLGYYPANTRRDGRYRKLEVKVLREGLTVRARKGFQAAKGNKPAERNATDAGGKESAPLRALMDSPLPESGLPIAVQAAAFKGTAPNASVLVTMQFGGQQFKFTEKGGTFYDTLEVSTMAIDSQGKIKAGAPQTVELKLRPQTRKQIEGAGFRLTSRMDLPPGRYQLRVAARSNNSGAAGSVHYDLEVPDFSKQDLSISGLSLTSTYAAVTPTGKVDDQLKDILPGPPSVMREFLDSETIALFAEVYDNEVSKPHKVDISTQVLAEDGKVVFKTDEERASAELKGAKGGYGITTQIPLKDVAPGMYVLRVQAKSRLGNDKDAQTGVGREVLFRVFPSRRSAPASAAPTPSGAAAPPASNGPASTAPAPGGQPAAPPPNPAAAVVQVTKGPQSKVTSYREVVARNDAEWGELWASLGLSRAMPKVNFTNTMIVAVFLGERPTAGYSVDILGVVKDGDTLVVGYAERPPGPNVIAAQMLTAPYAVAGVPMHAGAVRFEKVTQ